MRINKTYIGDIDSSFFSCEKDSQLITEQLFVKSKPYSDELKRLLLINNKDCLDDKTNVAYVNKIKNTSIADLIEQGYIRFSPKVKLGENEEVKNYLIISFDDFTPTSNIYYRDCTIMIDVICNTDCWDIGNYRQRPLKICGYIDGILNKTRLTGLGELEFMSCTQLILSENLSGYCLVYRAVHGSDDIIAPEDMEEEESYDESTNTPVTE